MKINPILDTDSYKFSHPCQYPEGTLEINSYIESRGGKFDSTVFFGLQMFIEEYMNKPITHADVDEAEEFVKLHGLPFDREGFRKIVINHGGYFPVKIFAIPEGLRIPNGNVQVQINNTDIDLPWVTQFIETKLLRSVWYPSTVATLSWECKKLIYKNLLKTSDDPDGQIDFKLHDFGCRGVSSLESAAIGGCAHLVNFKGTDTVPALLYAKRYYDEPMAGFSIPASEHSTITCWENEIDAFENMINRFGKPGQIFACVSDSFDLWKALDKWKFLKEKLINSGGILVIRPDSGNPLVTVKKTMNELLNKFGAFYNKKDYATLPPYLKVIQGDGVNYNTIEDILIHLANDRISGDSIAFGMGGGLLQDITRDTQKYAMKASRIITGEGVRDFNKNPVTDPWKASKKGKLKLIKDNKGVFKTVDFNADGKNILNEVYCVHYTNKHITKQKFSNIRKLAFKQLKEDLNY
jgi:nicotinamide phosphoribosyltransferase